MIGLKKHLKDIRRHWSSSLIVILTTALALALAFSLNVVGATFANTQAEIILDDRYAPPDLLIQAGRDVYFSVSDLNRITQEEGVEKVEGNLIVQGSALLEEEVINVGLIGVPKNTSIMTMDQIEPDTWNQFNGNKTLVDSFMAEELGIRTGDQITIFTESGSLDLTVLSLGKAPWTWNFGQPRYLQFLVPIEMLEAYIGVENEFNYIKIRLDPDASLNTMMYDINSLLEDRGYENFFIGKNQVTSNFDDISTIFSIFSLPSFLIAAALIGIVTRFQIVKEAKLIGTKKAIGYTPRQVLVEYLTRGVLYFLIAIPVAILLTSGISYVLVKLFVEQFYPQPTYYVSIEQGLMHLGSLFILVVLFGFFSARKAAKISVIDVIRYGMERPKNPTNFLAHTTMRLPLSVSIGLRNLLRNPGRFSFLLLGLAISGGASLGIISIANSFQTTISEGFDDATQWDFQITYQTTFNESLLSSLSSDVDDIKKVSPLSQFYLDSENFSLMVDGTTELDVSGANAPLFSGISLENSLLETRITDGNNLDTNKAGLLVSYKLASRFQLQVGQQLTFQGETTFAGSEINVSFEAPIVGVANLVMQNGWTFMFEASHLVQYINLEGNNPYNTLLVQVEDDVRNNEQEEQVLKDVLETTTNYSPQAIALKKDTLKSITALIDTFQELALGISLLVASVILLGIINVFSLNILERRWEFCMYQSIGMTRKDLFRILLSEALCLALFSFILSIPFSFLLGSILAYTVNVSPIGVWVIHQISYLELAILGTLFFIGLPLVVLIFSFKETRKKPIQQLKELK